MLQHFSQNSTHQRTNLAAPLDDDEFTTGWNSTQAPEEASAKRPGVEDEAIQKRPRVLFLEKIIIIRPHRFYRTTSRR